MLKKLYNYILFCTIVVFSSAAMDDNSKSITIIEEKLSQMSMVVEFLQKHDVTLSETALFLDYDETLAIRIIKHNGHKYQFLPSFDRGRTYRDVFLSAFSGSGLYLDSFSLTTTLGKDWQESYEVLDEVGTNNLIATCLANSCFAGVCSGSKVSDIRKEVMTHVGLDTENYSYAPDSKAEEICKKLLELIQSDKKISTVVLIENSKEYGIDPFLKVMPILAKSKDLTPLKIIGIEFTKFAEMATETAIKEELAFLALPLKNNTEVDSRISDIHQEESFSTSEEGGLYESDIQ